MLLHDDVVTDGQAQSGSFADGLGCKELMTAAPQTNVMKSRRLDPQSYPALRKVTRICGINLAAKRPPGGGH